MMKNAPQLKAIASILARSVPDAGLLRRGPVAFAIVFALSLAVMVSTALVVGSVERGSTEDALQRRADEIARSIDLKLSAYHAAVLTVAESPALSEEFDLARIERLARRVGKVFGGWFVITSGNEQVRQLMNTFTPEGTLFGPSPGTDRPELRRAEAESLQLGRSVTTDAFVGRLANQLIVATVTAITLPDDTTAILGFVATLDDINAWLMEAELAEDEFAAIADGSRRVIARSQHNKGFMLAGLPDWYVAFSEGRDSGVAVGPPLYGGAPRLFAMRRLEVAPGWTLAVSQPLASPLSALYRSAWPALSGLMALLLSGSIATLVLGRRRDRDEARRAAREAAERERLLGEVRASDARKSRLMAVLAHDLRTPLVAMLGGLDLFKAHLDKPPQKQMLHRLKADGHGMLTLIDDVLELARLGAGEARLRPEPFAPIALLTKVGDLVRPSAERHGTEIVIQVDDSPMLRGDAASLRRVLLNFATNAVKATRGGSVHLSATLGSAGADGQTLTFAVTDTGCGIAPDDIPRLFRDFGMLERDGIREDGTGLGLAICRRLAAAMGGEVGVESALGEGSRFWLRVTLPEAHDATPGADSETDDPSNVLAGLKVLVAEDHDVIRQLTCAQLARVGMLPTEAADGEIAVKLAEAEEFDLILMDLQMPRLDGDEAAERIREGDGPSARARIICVSGHQSPKIALMLSDLAFDGCVNKPLDLGQLSALMQGIVPSSVGTTSLEVFDAENLKQLRETDGGALLTRTLKSFAAEIETTRTDLAALIARRDTFGAGRLVHKLVGFGDILGARTMSAELRKFEDLIRDDDIENLEEALALMDDVMAKTRAQVERLIEETNRQSGL